MLRAYGPSTWVAVVVGAALAVLLFVPVAAYRYRATGRLRPIDVLTLLLVATYFVALWSYTLVPVPENNSFTCVAAQLHPFEFIADIRASSGPLLRNFAILQVVFNIVFFMPLGFFLRMLARRGVVVAVVVGFLTSLAIETTQLTGVWGVFHCAYRYFDVDDLIANTTGALLGSLVALPFAAMVSRRRPAPVVDHVTVGRRLVGAAVDVLVMTLIGFALVVGVRAVVLYLLQGELGDSPSVAENLVGLGVPLVLQGYWVLARGKTLGEDVVQLETSGPPTFVFARRLVKFVLGVGGFWVLDADLVPVPALLPIFVIASLVAVFVTRDHRGLSHLVAGLDLRVEREPPDEGT